MDYKFKSEKYRRIELTVRSGRETADGRIQVFDNQECLIYDKTMDKEKIAWLKIDISRNSTYVLSLKDIDIGEIYLSESSDMLEDGVRYLIPDEKNEMLCPADLEKWYDVPQREQYHFTPFLNWMNDPNGLCFYKGRYHLFYQKNPFDQGWGDMFWGHAVSRDLMHWKHLPIAFQPQEEIRCNPQFIGGAFSGSACICQDDMIVFFTRDREAADHDGPQIQYQVMSRSCDGVHFGPEETIIPAFSVPGSGADFRDPKVTFIDGSWYLVIGTQLYGKAAILLYKSPDLRKWDYLYPLIVEETEGIYAFECPDFFKLGDKYVVIGAWMDYTDEYGRFDPVRYYIGSFKDDIFTIESSGFCDFGCDFYATQSFFGTERRIAMSWITDWGKKQKPYQNGCRGSFTLPRVLKIREGRLYQEPAAEVYQMFDRELCCEKNRDILLEKIPGNVYCVQVALEEDTEFDIVFARSAEKEYSLRKHRGVLEIIGEGGGSRYIVPKCIVRDIEIFVDRRAAEIFINHGEYAGTKLILTDSKEGYLKTDIRRQNFNFCVKVSTIRSGWEKI